MQELPIAGAALLHSWARLCVFTALALMVGAWVFRSFVFRPALGGWPVGETWVSRAEARAAGQGVLAALLLLVGAALRLVAQMMEFLVPGEAVDEAVRFMVLETTWGWAWIAQVGLAVLGLVVFGVARAGGRAAWGVAGLVAAAACVTPAFSGHAAGVEHWRVLSIAADATHVFAAGVWVGGLFAVAGVASLETMDGPARGVALLRLVTRFSPLGILAVTLLALTGTFAAVLHLPTVADLFTTTWGRTLLVKLALVAGVAVLGLHHWRRATPALRRGASPLPFARTILLELAVALLVLMVTALLTASPLPGE